MNNNNNKTIGVIGCGASGIIVIKELLEQGNNVICFEKSDSIGGIYTNISPNTLLTTSSLLTAFSDYSDGNERNPKFWSAQEYIYYLEEFVKTFHLQSNIHFNSEVKSIKYDTDKKKWLINVNFEKLQLPKDNLYEVDAIAICSGINSIPNIPILKNQTTFTGKIIHSSECKEMNMNIFTNKRVFIIGSGETTADLCHGISRIASKIGILIRETHGHIVVRGHSPGYVSDTNTNRARYSNPYILGSVIATLTQFTKLVLSYFKNNTNNTKIMKKIFELNSKQKTSAFSKFGCKNENFVKSIIFHGAEIYNTKNFSINEKNIVFDDGTQFADCDIILLCTGYKSHFPYLEQYHPELFEVAKNPRENFKQMFPCFRAENDIAFFGFVRPAFGSIPPIVELQARLFGLVINDKIKLPNNITEVSKKDALEWDRRFCYDSNRINSIVDFQIYCDSLAELIGCMPNLKKIFFTNPYLWMKIFFGPFTMHQYRIEGPNSNIKRALSVYYKQPFGGFLEIIITFTFLIISKILSLFGWKQFTPNNF